MLSPWHLDWAREELLALALAFTTVGCLLPRRTLQSRWLSRFRILWPSWHFFDRVQPPTHLEIRLKNCGEVDTSWHALAQQPQRWRVGCLFINASVTTALLAQSRVLSLISDCEAQYEDATCNIEANCNYLAISRYLRELILTSYPDARGCALAEFQFRIEVRDPQSSTEPISFSLTSSWQRLHQASIDAFETSPTVSAQLGANHD